MQKPILIYCAAGNKARSEIAQNYGFLHGAQLPGTVYFPLYFADQDFKKPNKSAYISALKTHRPTMASVIDWEAQEQINEVLEWAEEAAAYVETVMIIPKVHGGIPTLPRMIGGKPVRLGFSVPTKFGGTEVSVSEFAAWPVHLLGGSPAAQMKYSYYLSAVSADGNMANKMANRGLFWRMGKTKFSNCWESISINGERFNGNGPLEAFRRSCENIAKFWEAR